MCLNPNGEITFIDLEGATPENAPLVARANDLRLLVSSLFATFSGNHVLAAATLAAYVDAADGVVMGQRGTGPPAMAGLAGSLCPCAGMKTAFAPSAPIANMARSATGSQPCAGPENHPALEALARSAYIWPDYKGEAPVGLGDIADNLTRRIESLGAAGHEALFEPVIRLGVTGLSRAGKTVFITSLVANLLNRSRMQGLSAASEGRIEAAFLQPQPDLTVPRFDYEAHLAALSGPRPHWPASTSSVSELRLSFRVRPAGMLSGLRRARIVHLDIVDYPGEWLLDLALLDLSYGDWSAQVLERIAAREAAAPYLAALKANDGAAKLDEVAAKALAAQYTAYLHAAREAGFADCTPGRFLLPGDLAGSPALTFAPLARPDKAPRGSTWRIFERRFEAYKAQVVKPFFRRHFAGIDRQVVLVDVLGAIHAGPAALEDLRRAMAETLAAFRPGRNAWLSRLFMGRRVERILFAATKADHLHHSQHGRLTAITEALLAEARRRADFAGAQSRAMAIAALRATTEETIEHDGRKLDCVRGTLLDGRNAAFYAGELPRDPARLLGPAREGAQKWLDADYQIMRFAPAPLELAPGEGPPHIRLDKAAQFLIGDKL